MGLRAIGFAGDGFAENGVTRDEEIGWAEIVFAQDGGQGLRENVKVSKKKWSVIWD